MRGIEATWNKGSPLDGQWTYKDKVKEIRRIAITLCPLCPGSDAEIFNMCHKLLMPPKINEFSVSRHEIFSGLLRQFALFVKCRE